jgi:hypothetical protein
MSKTKDLADALIATLDASSLGRDEKVKAIGAARNHLNTHTNNLEAMRAARVQAGPVGSTKKNEPLLKSIEELAFEDKREARKKKPASKPVQK